MKSYYFTFGIGQSLLANRYVEIEAENYEAAREIMIESFGTKFAFQYSEEVFNVKNIAERHGLQKLNVNEFWKE